MFPLSTLRILLAALIITLAFPSFRAIAAEEFDPETFRKCAETVNRIARLMCYDEVANAIGLMNEEKQEREEKILKKYGFWEVTKRKTASGEEVIYLKNNAAEEAKLTSGVARVATFVIMCKHGRTDAYIDWKSQLVPHSFGGVSTIGVVYQIDSGERKSQNWELSTDRQAAFSPDAVSFIKELRKKDKLIMQITPMYEATQTLVHEIAGLEEVLNLLVDSCYN